MFFSLLFSAPLSPLLHISHILDLIVLKSSVSKIVMPRSGLSFSPCFLIISLAVEYEIGKSLSSGESLLVLVYSSTRLAICSGMKANSASFPDFGSLRRSFLSDISEALIFKSLPMP